MYFGHYNESRYKLKSSFTTVIFSIVFSSSWYSALIGNNADYGSNAKKKSRKVSPNILSLTKKIMESEWNL